MITFKQSLRGWIKSHWRDLDPAQRRSAELAWVTLKDTDWVGRNVQKLSSADANAMLACFEPDSRPAVGRILSAAEQWGVAQNANTTARTRPTTQRPAGPTPTPTAQHLPLVRSAPKRVLPDALEPDQLRSTMVAPVVESLRQQAEQIDIESLGRAGLQESGVLKSNGKVSKWGLAKAAMNPAGAVRTTLKGAAGEARSKAAPKSNAKSKGTSKPRGKSATSWEGNAKR